MTTVDDRPAAGQDTAQQKVAERNAPIVSAGAATGVLLPGLVYAWRKGVLRWV